MVEMEHLVKKKEAVQMKMHATITRRQLKTTGLVISVMDVKAMVVVVSLLITP